MIVGIELFTLYAQLQGEQLFCNGFHIPIINATDYQNGLTGYFIIHDLKPGFEIVKYISPPHAHA